MSASSCTQTQTLCAGVFLVAFPAIAVCHRVKALPALALGFGWHGVQDSKETCLLQNT